MSNLNPRQFQPVAALTPLVHAFPDEDYVERYAERMRTGAWDWGTEGDPIHVTKEGILLDGTHRVLAAERAGVEQVPVVDERPR